MEVQVQHDNELYVQINEVKKNTTLLINGIFGSFDTEKSFKSTLEVIIHYFKANEDKEAFVQTGDLDLICKKWKTLTPKLSLNSEFIEMGTEIDLPANSFEVGFVFRNDITMQKIDKVTVSFEAVLG